MPRQRLKPNGFARMARFSIENRHVVAGVYLLAALLCAGFAAVMLKVDPEARPLVTLDPQTLNAQTELDKRFPGIDDTFLAIVENRDPDLAREQAVALSAALSQRSDLFRSSFVPGAGPFYEDNALLFDGLEDVQARVNAVLQMQPLYQALAAAPDIPGLSALVSELSRAVEQGRSPPGFEALLTAVAATIESDVRGTPRPIDWPRLAGLGGEPMSQRWFVIATPVEGGAREAAGFAQQTSAGIKEVHWLWPRKALGNPSNPLRDFLVPAGLSVFVTLTLLGAGLGSFRLTLALALPAGVTLAAAAAAAAGIGRPLDGATWSFAAAVLAPVVVSGTTLALTYAQARGKGLSLLQSAMLAAHRRGGLTSVFTILFAAVWLAWLLRQLPSLSQFASIALVGAVVAWFAMLTLLPAAISLFDRAAPRPGSHWLDDIFAEEPARNTRNALDVLAILVIAAAVFCAAFLPGLRFGERHLPTDPPPLLETPDARGAVHVLVKPEEADAVIADLSKLAEVGAIRSITQFMPPDPAPKLAELRRLEEVAPLEPVLRAPPGEQSLAASFGELEERLTAIASGPAASDELRNAALKLRRAVTLFTSPAPATESRVAALESALFRNLGQLSRRAEGLSRLAAPGLDRLDPQLRGRFIAGDGTWRIEVMPKSGVGLLSFGAALRRTFPTAAGEPLAALARNEIIHRETLLALSTALVAAAILALAALRNLKGWVISLAPVGAFLTLTAAIVVLLGLGLDSALLAATSATTAVLICSSMVLGLKLSQPDAAMQLQGAAFRAALLPPVVLAGAVAPLALSSRPAVAELGFYMTLLLMLSAFLCLLLVPALSRWIGSFQARPARANGR